MKQVIATALVLLLLAGAGAHAAGGSGADDPRLAAAKSWAFGLGAGMLAGDSAAVGERLGDHDLVVVDGEEARRGDVRELQARGSAVLAYLSVGTIERWRSWFEQTKRFRLRAWRDWEGEWFADVSRPGLRRVLAGRIAPAILAKGFDGLFLDNVDMVEARRHRGQRRGMRKLVARLARLTHADGGLLFAQNGFRGLRALGMRRHLDGWNREDVTWTYDFDRRRYVRNPNREIRAALDELRRMRGRGLFVTATDYTARSGARAEAEAVASACSAGALPYVSNIGLTAKRLPEPPLTC